MALPVEIVTRTVTYGPETDFQGNSITGSLTFTPSEDITWVAAGQGLHVKPITVNLNSSGSGSIDLICTDQTGFRNANGQNITNWFYTVTADLVGVPGSTRKFVVPSGVGSLDLDTMIPITTSGVTISVPVIVNSVAGRTGAVTLTKNDVGLSNIDNTADASKPVSTPQAAALAPKTALYLQGTATGNEATAIQAVLDAAGADEIVRLYGTFNTSSTVTITKNVDASGAVINYSGSGVAVQVGATGTATLRKTIVLPRIICTTKPTTGWVTGTIGLKITNAYSFDVTVPHVQGFEVGMLVYGENSNGTSYTAIHLGHLDNNQINHKLSATTTGWSNENRVFGGRMSHNTAEGVPCVGTKHVLIEHPTGNSDPNNNLWVGTALESPGVVEWTIDAVGGSNNRWINCRFEFTSGNSKVRWGATATRNIIDNGNSTENIQETFVTGTSFNRVQTATSARHYSSGDTQSVVFENQFGNTSPAFSIMEAGGSHLGPTATATAYAGRFTAQGWFGKRASDAFERVKIDPLNSRIYLGGGAAAPVAFISGSASSIVINGVGLYHATDATFDIGAVSSLRFRDAHLSRYVRAGTAVVTGAAATASRPNAVVAGAGAMFYDTTLSKPIWSDGTNWKDATGTTV